MIAMLNVADRLPHIRILCLAVVAAAILPLSLWAQGDSLPPGDTAVPTSSGDSLLLFDTGVLIAVPDTLRDARLFVYDSSSFAPRSFPAEELDAYREESDFDYARKTAPPTSFWERILRWLADLLGSIFGNDAGRFVFQYGIFIAALVLVIVLLMRTELGGIFKRAVGRKKGTIEFEEVEEDLARMDFDALIAEAIAAGNLRRAVRLHYLQLLREMTERGLIEWRREKTNSDYLYELARRDLHADFAELTRVFDYVWYGGAEIDMERYRRISAGFGLFTRTVQGGA